MDAFKDLRPEFFQGFHPKKRTAGTAFSQENIFDAAATNELELKRQKLSEKNDEESNKPKCDMDADLSIFANLPSDLFIHHIVPVISVDWIRVSRFYHELAMNNLDRDPRFLWNDQTFQRAMAVDNLRVVKLLSQRGFLSEGTEGRSFLRAVANGCVKVVNYFVTNDLIAWSSQEEITCFYDSAVKHALFHDSPDIIVEILLSSGKVTDLHLGKNNFLSIAAERGSTSKADILISNGFYDESTLIYVIQNTIASKFGCDLRVMRILIRTIQHRLTVEETLNLLRISIKQNVPHAVEYFLEEVLASNVTLSEEFPWLAVSSGSKKILRKLKNDSRAVWNPSLLVKQAALGGYPKILKILLDEPGVDATSLLNMEIFSRAMQSNEDNQNNTVFVMLDNPSINFNFFASFSLWKALEYGQSFVAASILNDERFIVMDLNHFEAAMNVACRLFKTHIIQGLEAIKYKAVLSPTEQWSPPPDHK